MLIKAGWKKDVVEKNTPILPSSGWMTIAFTSKEFYTAWQGDHLRAERGRRRQGRQEEVNLPSRASPLLSRCVGVLADHAHQEKGKLQHMTKTQLILIINGEEALDRATLILFPCE